MSTVGQKKKDTIGQKFYLYHVIITLTYIKLDCN